MRRRRTDSELARLAAPLARVVDAIWRRMHWWLALLALAYLLSGITVIRPDEVAVILRWGRLVGATPALQEHGPGLLFAFPRPMDRVTRVKVKHVSELQVDTLAPHSMLTSTLDPLLDGYAITGDHNVVHAEVMVRYQVREPAQWSFYAPNESDILRLEVTAAMVRSLGEMGVDRVLSDGRKELVATATKRAQAGLDEAHSGLAITSLELTS
ncbi:MAG: SPFH domain-containing protein, partial [Stellaceae bacterium]